MTEEIEKKYLIDSLEDIKNLFNEEEKEFITQNYLVTGDEEIRIRKTINYKSEVKNYLTIKCKKTDLIREENEVLILNETYDCLEKNIKSLPIKKIRYTFKYNNYLVYLDVFENYKLILAEIEFANLKKANDFKVFSWLGEEVTNKQEYKNQCIWIKINQNHP